MPEPEPPELIYDGECPYCRAIKAGIRASDIRGSITYTDINSPRGRALVEEHHGEFVDSPHLFTDQYVHYGVVPVARAVGVTVPKSFVGRV